MSELPTSPEQHPLRLTLKGAAQTTLTKRQGMAPNEWVTDKCPAYGAALRELNLTSATHVWHKRANN